MTEKPLANWNCQVSAYSPAKRELTRLTGFFFLKRKNNPYIPSDEDIRKILEASENTEYKIPIILACYGMRRSEICALTTDDIDGDVIHINKAIVMNDKKEWVIKWTKTTTSTRDIVIQQNIADMIIERGYIYNEYPNNITDFLSRTQKCLGTPHFSVHKLGHYFASKMSAMDVPDEEIMRFDGWKTDHVMKSVYRHAMQDKNKEAQRTITNRFGPEPHIFQRFRLHLTGNPVLM